jgi:two-component system sensor histidine kinase QseC
VSANSIRVRLFAVLLLATGAVWLSAVAWIYLSTQAQVEKVLDARLQEAARMVNSLITDRRIDVASAVRTAVEGTKDFEIAETPYDRQLSCQIWSLSGVLVGQSEGAPQQPLASHESGFQETSINGVDWRVYAVVNEKLGVRVLVGDSLDLRRKLIDNVVKGLLLPVGLILPILAALIWISVGRGLRPLRRLATGLAQRSADDLHPIAAEGSPSELQPVARSLNGLFARVRESRERERNFTAFAAHELKTPLAGLRTQAQVALASRDPENRDRALGRIIQGVDRSSRLVRQLLDLAEAEIGKDPAETSPARIPQILDDVADSLRGVAAGKDVRLDIAPEFADLVLLRGRELMTVALRNVLENAFQYAPSGTAVRCWPEQADERFLIRIRDEGPGMSETEIMRAGDRFFRGAAATGVGSGLGLSIVDAAMRNLGGTASLDAVADGGLTATLSVPAGLVARIGEVSERTDGRDRWDTT